MDCPTCGGDNRETARFCRHCGASLVISEPEETPSVIDVAGASPEEAEAEVETAQSSLEAPQPPADAAAGPLREPVTSAEDEASRKDVTVVVPEATLPAEGATPIVEVVEALGEETTPFDTAQARWEEPHLADEPPRTEAGEHAPASEAKELSPQEPVPGATAPEAAEIESEETEVRATGTVPVVEALPELQGETARIAHDEIESPPTIEPGTVLADRYVVVEALDLPEGEVLYRAQDLQRCRQCGFEGNASDETYCVQCGAKLDRRPAVQLLEVTDTESEPPHSGVVQDRLTYRGRAFLVLVEPEVAAQMPAVPTGIRLLVGQRSDTGRVRELDEDSMVALTVAPTYESQTGPVLGLFAVADGMGGHEGGEIASKMALKVLADRVLRGIILPELAEERASEESILTHLRQSTVAANDAVYLDRQKRQNDMGTTLTAALFRDNQLFLAHVGDCRAYRWNAAGLEQLTTDHSLVASMVASGQAAPEEIYTHPHRSVIYRCIGDTPLVEVDTIMAPVAHGDRIIVCSDGLWEMIRDEGIEDVMLQEADPQAASELLVHHANLAGGEDNISVVVVQLEAA